MSYPRIAVLLPLLVTAIIFPASARAQWPPYYPGYPGYYRLAAPESDLKFDVTPKTAAVYVDGYFAGQIDDYNGVFERLHVAPGEHEIIVYLEGYHSLRQHLYLSPNRTKKIEGELKKLEPGDTAEPVPVPADRPQTLGPAGEDDQEFPVRPTPRRPAAPPLGRQPQPAPSRSGSAGSINATLSIRVQPGGAAVLIDGEQWQGPASSADRLVIEVAEGHHTVEVRHDGYERFVAEIDARRGQTESMNISLGKSQ